MCKQLVSHWFPSKTSPERGGRKKPARQGQQCKRNTKTTSKPHTHTTTSLRKTAESPRCFQQNEESPRPKATPTPKNRNKTNTKSRWCNQTTTNHNHDPLKAKKQEKTRNTATTPRAFEAADAATLRLELRLRRRLERLLRRAAVNATQTRRFAREEDERRGGRCLEPRRLWVGPFFFVWFSPAFQRVSFFPGIGFQGPQKGPPGLKSSHIGFKANECLLVAWGSLQGRLRGFRCWGYHLICIFFIFLNISFFKG